jgi:hypothetical protein
MGIGWGVALCCVGDKDLGCSCWLLVLVRLRDRLEIDG